MAPKGAMLKRPAADLSSDEPAANDVARVEAEAMCYRPAHEILSFSLKIVCIWLCLGLALLCGYSSCILSALYL